MCQAIVSAFMAKAHRWVICIPATGLKPGAIHPAHCKSNSASSSKTFLPTVLIASTPFLYIVGLANFLLKNISKNKHGLTPCPMPQALCPDVISYFDFFIGWSKRLLRSNWKHANRCQLLMFYQSIFPPFHFPIFQF